MIKGVIMLGLLGLFAYIVFNLGEVRGRTDQVNEFVIECHALKYEAKMIGYAFICQKPE